jgi:hypothetical protein
LDGISSKIDILGSLCGGALATRRHAENNYYLEGEIKETMKDDVNF